MYNGSSSLLVAPGVVKGDADSFMVGETVSVMFNEPGEEVLDEIIIDETECCSISGDVSRLLELVVRLEVGI